MGTIDIPKDKLYMICDGATCLSKQNLPCDNCTLKAHGYEYPHCRGKLGDLIIELETGKIGGLAGTILRAKYEKIEELEDKVKELEKKNEEMDERISIMMEGGWVPDWHYFKLRPMTEEEKEYYGMEDCEDATMFDDCPCDGEEVLLLTHWGMSIDTYHWDIDGAYLDDHEEIEPGWAWAEAPKYPKKDGKKRDCTGESQ